MDKSKSLEEKIRPIGLKKDILVQELEKELLLYDLERNKAFCLNETSRMVWNLCDGENTVEDIHRKVSLQLKTQIPEELIWLALEGLNQEKILSNYQEIKINYNGLKRREAIKKIGFTTMTVLPLVLAVVSPKSVAAQSQAVCSGSTFCQCLDASCIEFGELALLQNACEDSNMNCGGIGLNNCLCVGRFFCGQEDGIRFGMCGLV
mgnify:CR=1 FL=1